MTGEPDTLVVAAQRTYPEYLLHGVYIRNSKPGLAQPFTHVAFYLDGEIKRHVARVELDADDVSFTETGLRRLGLRREQTRRLALPAEARRGQSPRRLLFLSLPDSEETVVLRRPIPNDLRAANGKPYAFTQGHRYASLVELMAVAERAGGTSDLV